MIGLALTVIALAASAAATGYIDGREYVYQYTGFINTGFPRIKPQDSGYAYNVKLRIQPEGDAAIFKVEHANRIAYNDEFEDVLKEHHEFQDLPPHAEFLTRPFRVHRKNGIVTHFQVTRDEPSFSVNLKRGIASLFNLNFDHVESGLSTEENDIQRPDPDAHYYKVYEDSVLGECETAYVIEHHPYDRTHNIVLNVTKVRNFHKCNSRPNQVYSVFHGHECGETDHEKSHTLHGGAQYHYSIRGDRHHYIIEKIRTESDVGYTPYPQDGQTASATIKRTFELVEEKPVSDPIQISGDLEDQTSLVYDFDYQRDFKDPIDLKKPHYLYHLTGRKVPISDIRNQVEELVNVYKDDTYTEKFKDKNFPAKFVELLRSVATLGYDEIEDLYKAYADIPKSGATPEQRRYRNLFVDTLVNLGTNPAFLFGKYLVENKKALPQESLYFVQQLQFHLKEVSEVLFEKFQELCDHENVKKNPTLHIACITSFSNVVFDHCVARYHPEGIREGKNVCPYEVATKYFNYVAGLYDKTTNEKLRFNYLKVASNFGVKEILPYLEPYVEGRGAFHHIERGNAIWGLMNVAHRYPDKVRALLVPLLFNRTENYEHRLASFIILLRMRPELYEIEGMARAIKYDTDDQVRSFVYSTFKSLANSTHICDRRLSKQATYALRILEDVKHEFESYDYSYSQNNYYAGYDPDYDFGGSSTFAYFASDTGYIPRTIYMGFEDYIGGKSMHTFAVGMKQYGLEKFFDKFFGPEGTFGRRSVFDLFKKREKRDVSGAQKELNEIKGKLNLPVYDYDHIHGEIFFKYMGKHLSSFQFDDKTFEQFFKEGRFSIPNIPAAYQKIPAFFYQRFMLTVDKFYVLPTESGIPLLFDYKQPVYYYHRNKESSLKVEPGFFPEDRGGEFPEHVRAETDGHFAIDKNLIAYMGVVIPFDQVIFGAGINKRCTLSLPLKVKLDLQAKEKKLKTHWTPVAPHEIYHFKYEPFTFIDSYANSVPQTIEEGYKPVRRIHRHDVEKSYFHDTFGVGFDVKADYENEFNDFGSWVDFFLEKDYREKFYYLYANPNFEPYNVDVQFSYAGKDTTREVETEFSYHFFGENWIIPHFPEENFEDFDRQKEDRGPLCTCAIKYNVIARGDKERKIHAVTSWTRDLKRTFHKFNFFYERTPFTPHETEDLKICGSSYLKYPKLDLIKFATLDTFDMEQTVKTEMKVHFGKSCNADQKFKVQGLITESEEQRDFNRRRDEPDTPEHYNEYAYYYQECLRERERGINYGEACMDYFDRLTTLHKYTFDVKYENLHPEFLNKTYMLGRMIRYMFYTHSDHNELDVHNPVGEMHIEANFSAKLPVADFRIQKPTSNNNYYNVYFPRYVGFSSWPMFEDAHVKHSFSDLYCGIEGDEVFTFDRYKYTLPPIDCYKVVAKDCSPKEYFTVLATKIKHPKYHKAVKVFLGDHKIEALPISDDSDIIVRVDGKRVALSPNEPYLYRDGDEYEPLFYVAFRDFYYTLHSRKYGLIVEYDGHAVFVQVSPYYRSKLCGLCGNYNGQKHDGGATSEGCYYRDEKDFAYSYSIPSETCSVPRPDHICPAEGGFGCTRLRTQVLQLTTGKVPQTCFSTEPVSECAAHCKATGTVTRRVYYHCLPAKDDSTKALLREQEKRVLYELSRKSRDHETVVEVPDRCYKE
jgi:hypothetical protein